MAGPAVPGEPQAAPVAMERVAEQVAEPEQQAEPVEPAAAHNESWKRERGQAALLSFQLGVASVRKSPLIIYTSLVIF